MLAHTRYIIRQASGRRYIIGHRLEQESGKSYKRVSAALWAGLGVRGEGRVALSGTSIALQLQPRLGGQTTWR